ncbi:MAG: superoxide dismutase [Planctomycetota bacterium]
MAITLPALPYAIDALAPHISKETLTFHHGKHHNAYVTKVNETIKGTEHESKSLEQLIKEKVAFNAAAQTWNHTFYWQSMKPGGGGAPTGKVADAINASFGSFEAFKEKFSGVAAGHFASGWAWLVKNKDGKLAIVDTHDAGTIVGTDQTAILTCDVWEHAYYIDYRNARGDYIKAWWNLVNWDFANKNLG